MNRESRKKLKLKKVRTKVWNKQAGFVSLFALLLANIFLVIGVSLFGISLKELSLSTGGGESMRAFFAADGGMECSLYWDIRQDAFAIGAQSSVIDCAGQNNISVTVTDLGGGDEKSDFDFNFIESDVDSPFVKVEVTKKADGSTVIKSYGRNNNNPNNRWRVERAWKVSY